MVSDKYQVRGVRNRLRLIGKSRKECEVKYRPRLQKESICQ